MKLTKNRSTKIELEDGDTVLDLYIALGALRPGHPISIWPVGHNKVALFVDETTDGVIRG